MGNLEGGVNFPNCSSHGEFSSAKPLIPRARLDTRFVAPVGESARPSVGSSSKMGSISEIPRATAAAVQIVLFHWR